MEAKQYAQPPLAQVVLLGPSLVQLREGVRGHLERAHRLDRAHVDVERAEQLAHPGAVKTSGLVSGQLAGDFGSFGGLHSDLIHSEALHYDSIQGSGVIYT